MLSVGIDLDCVCLNYTTTVETIPALVDVTVSVREGQLTALVGSSGSGKTTLVNVMAGLQLPTSGHVRVAGHELHGLSERQRASARLRDIGVVFQDHNLIPEFTVAENVTVPLRAQGISRSEAMAAAGVALTSVGLGELGARYPHEISGGQRQRVGIARSTSGGKKVLLADEPTGSLDEATSRGVFALLRKLADSGVAVVVATHDLDIYSYADTIIRMRDGRATLSSAEAILNSPRYGPT